MFVVNVGTIKLVRTHILASWTIKLFSAEFRHTHRYEAQDDMNQAAQITRTSSIAVDVLYG